MSTREVTYFQAVCDGCGTVEDDYGDFSALADPGSAVEWATDGGWFRTTDAQLNEVLLCETCQECEVCGADGHVVDDHLVCDEHEDHDFTEPTLAPEYVPVYNALAALRSNL